MRKFKKAQLLFSWGCLVGKRDLNERSAGPSSFSGNTLKLSKLIQ